MRQYRRTRRLVSSYSPSVAAGFGATRSPAVCDLVSGRSDRAARPWLRNQIEGGTLQGVSRALVEEITWDEKNVTSVDWAAYQSLPLGVDLPEVETVLIDRRDVAAMGAGETTIALAAAIGNAFFDATGARIRKVPFTREGVKAALGV